MRPIVSIAGKTNAGKKNVKKWMRTSMDTNPTQKKYP